MSPTGLTRDAGWQVGVSRTFPIGTGAAWRFLTSRPGLRLWLGDVAATLSKGAMYETADGIRGEVRSLHPSDRLRLTWKPEDRQQPATVQLTVRPTARGTTVRFHTDHLVSADDRECLRDRWREALDRIETAIAPSPDPGAKTNPRSLP